MLNGSNAIVRMPNAMTSAMTTVLTSSTTPPEVLLRCMRCLDVGDDKGETCFGLDGGDEALPGPSCQANLAKNPLFVRDFSNASLRLSGRHQQLPAQIVGP